MVDITIKCNVDAEGFTGGNSYPVLGYSGGGALVLDDNSNFKTVAFASFEGDEASWGVVTDKSKVAKAKAKAVVDEPALVDAPDSVAKPD